MSLAPGTRLHHYEIQNLFGKGGMGEVYRARDTRLGREVAIETLPAEVSGAGDRILSRTFRALHDDPGFQGLLARVKPTWEAMQRLS